jgi:hypothetical protein
VRSHHITHWTSAIAAQYSLVLTSTHSLDQCHGGAVLTSTAEAKQEATQTGAAWVHGSGRSGPVRSVRVSTRARLGQRERHVAKHLSGANGRQRAARLRDRAGAVSSEQRHSARLAAFAKA